MTQQLSAVAAQLELRREWQSYTSEIAGDRRRRSGRRKSDQPSRITIPAGVHPLVALVFAEMARQGITYEEMEIKSGVLRTTIKAWRTHKSPMLLSIDAVLRALGITLVPTHVSTEQAA
jgi:hypothetical protein